MEKYDFAHLDVPWHLTCAGQTGFSDVPLSYDPGFKEDILWIYKKMQG